MELEAAVVIVTGAGNGIGAALARRFAREGAAGVTVVDLDEAAATTVAEDIGGLAVVADVGDEDQIRAAVTRTEQRFGPVDLFVANAGIARGGGPDAPDEDFEASWRVNVMQGVWGARAVLPSMLERGSGHILVTASAAGLLTNLGALPYSLTKHAAVALAEWLEITYADRGVRASCLCPQFVDTAMLEAASDSPASAEFVRSMAIHPEQVADVVVDGLREGRFLHLPHPEVATYEQRRATDRERWLAGMRRLQATLAD
ncbi:MAG TPA: SDR family NAD(P)-dependent oxidoreductase [Nitriliruptorales bacterium]